MAEELLKEVQHGIADLFSDSKKNEDQSPAAHAYANIEKASILQAARNFHDSTIVQENPKLCITIMAQLLHLNNNTSQKLLPVEATEVFFAATKLFVSSESSLKRMVYLFIKDVCHYCDPSDVIIVTSCLTKDMTCDSDICRANSLRALVHVIDSAMLGALERYIKQAIIDKTPLISSSALVSSIHFFQSSSESASMIRRWVREVAEAIESPNYMVQFHATQLFFLIKANDRLGVSKFLQKYAYSGPSLPGSSSNNSVRSPLALICFIRYTAKLMHDELINGCANTSMSVQAASQLCASGYSFLKSSLRHKSEIVTFEAARVICNLPFVQAEDVHPALSVLHLMLSSPKPSARMGAVKTLRILSSTYPRLTAKFNEDLEGLLGDSNRLVGTLSIMTLLKTGNENSIDRLLRSIADFLTYIAEEYKIMVVKSLEDVCIVFPKKHVAVIGFLSKFLREEGGFRFKRTIVRSMISLMNRVEETRESSLMQLCEFIEDCEFVFLSTEILHLLGELGPKTTCPARYVRFVYNRMILENAMVRAAAVLVLGKFGAGCPFLRVSIIAMLKRCLNDEDDEVRDRASLTLDALELADTECPFRSGVEKEEEGDLLENKESCADDPGVFLLRTQLPITFHNLQQRLEMYRITPGVMESPETLSLDVLPLLEDTSNNTESLVEENDQFGIGSKISTSSALFPPKQLEPSAILHAIPEFATFGRVFRSSDVVPLTENEAEYVVRCIKHIYEECIVLQFIVQNTIEDQLLKNVSVALDCQSDVFECTGEIAAETIDYGAHASCFSVLQKNSDVTFSPCYLICELKFTVVSVDSETGEEKGDSFDEEYALEDFDLNISDFISQTSVNDFRKSWDGLAGKGEALQKFSLRESNLQDATRSVIKCSGLHVSDGTSRVRSGVKQHMIHLSGTFLWGGNVLARSQVSISSHGTIILKIAVRSENIIVSKMIVDMFS